MLPSLDTYPHRNNTVRTIGRCIYCGATEGLTKEHPIPEFLNGRLAIEAASCARCQKITSGFESKCANLIFSSAVPFMGFKKKDPKRRRGRFPVAFIVDGKRQIKRVEAHEYPQTLRLHAYAPPDYVAKRDPLSATPIPTKGWGWTFENIHEPPGAWDRKISRLHKQYGASHVILPADFDDRSFARLLAKIGYGYAVAQFDYGFFLPLILKTILEDDQPTGQFVGGIENPAPLPPDIQRDLPRLDHLVAFRRERNNFGYDELWTDIRLFTKFGNVPVYTALIGIGDFSPAAIALHRAVKLWRAQGFAGTATAHPQEGPPK